MLHQASNFLLIRFYSVPRHFYQLKDQGLLLSDFIVASTTRSPLTRLLALNLTGIWALKCSQSRIGKGPVDINNLRTKSLQNVYYLVSTEEGGV